MANLEAACRDDNDGDVAVIGEPSVSPAARIDGGGAAVESTLAAAIVTIDANGVKDEEALDELCSDENSVYGTPEAPDTDNNHPQVCPNLSPETEVDDDGEEEEEEEEEEGRVSKKLKNEPIELEITGMPLPEDEITPLRQNGEHPTTANRKTGKKSKKRSKDVWSTTSRKGKKRAKSSNHNGDALQEDKVLITPISRFPEKEEDGPDLKIRLSKVYKAEKVELGEDRLTAGGTKGYRMVRATRGVEGGAWYFEIKVVHLGKTGHTRLGWSTDKGELQAPVGYDKNSFGYRDIDGSKVHKALREKYGAEGYKEGDVIGFYINLPDGGSYAPKPPRYVWYKGQRYVCAPDDKEDPPKVVPGSEIAYYKNGTCQGVAFRNLYGGRYYPAASMYTLPNQPNCVVKFNFGPDFECFPDEFVDRPVPRPMIEVPYQSYDDSVENCGSIEKKQ